GLASPLTSPGARGGPPGGADAGADGVVTVPPGEEAIFLDPLSLQALPLDVGAQRALDRLGVRTIGAFARPPANAVAPRRRPPPARPRPGAGPTASPGARTPPRCPPGAPRRPPPSPWRSSGRRPSSTG